MQQETGTLYTSTGKLHYDKNKLIVIVDPEIARYYRALIPKWIRTNPQLYPPHISVVRKEVPPKMVFWGKYEGELIKFRYSNIIYSGKVYWWLNAYATRLEEIRIELGLPVSSEYTRPPDTFLRVFHITIGNCK